MKTEADPADRLLSIRVGRRGYGCQMDLTEDDRMRARDLGGNEAEEFERTGDRPREMRRRQLWKNVMGDAKIADYPTDAVSALRAERDLGFDSYL